MYVYISSIKSLIKIPLETESSKFSITASQSTSQPSLQGSKKRKTNLQKQSRNEIETTYAYARKNKISEYKEYMCVYITQRDVYVYIYIYTQHLKIHST